MPVPAAPGCGFGQLAISVVRGGAALGTEVAGLLFRNHSATTCTLSGYPSAQLLVHGAPAGAPATHSARPIQLIVLRPGNIAQSHLTVRTTCNAPVADAVRITPPGRTRPVERAIKLRACPPAVTPVGRN